MSSSVHSNSRSFSIYRPRSPRQTSLYRLIEHYYDTYLERCELEGVAVPAWVQRRFDTYLRCGLLEHGFARAHCFQCGYDYLVAFSCKGRGLCPSCNGKAMVETAAHLVDEVLPRVSYCQWVLTMPKRIRYFLGQDPHLASGILRLFLRHMERTLKRRSASLSKSRITAVGFIQRYSLSCGSQRRSV